MVKPIKLHFILIIYICLFAGVIRHSSHGHGHYRKRSEPEICNEDKEVKCSRVPVYEEEVVDVEVSCDWSSQC